MNEEILIKNYISRHYPIKLVKINKRFKRGVILNKIINGFSVTDKIPIKEGKINVIREHIINDTMLVFGFTREFVYPIVIKHIS